MIVEANRSETAFAFNALAKNFMPAAVWRPAPDIIDGGKNRHAGNAH